MDKSKQTKEDAVQYFKELSHSYAVDSRRSGNCPVLAAKAEAYELAAFHLERNVC